MSTVSIYLLEQQMQGMTKQLYADMDHARNIQLAQHEHSRPAARTLWQIGRLRFVWAPR
jgi:hypothetical protein